MKGVFLALLAIACLSCSKEESVDPNPSLGVYPDLRDQIERVEPKLELCGGLVAHPWEMGDCATGDGVLFAAIYNTVTGSDIINEAVRASLAPSGRPCRSPAHLARGEDKCEVSRDWLMGFITNLTVSKDRELAERLWGYMKSNDYWMCPRSMEITHCFPTPPILILMGDVWEYNGWGRPKDMDYDFVYTEAANVKALKAQARGRTGYPLHLTSLHVYIKSMTGHLTEGVADVAAILHERQPENLWFDYVDNLSHGGKEERYKSIAEKLTDYMVKWPMGPKQDWAWQRDDEEKAWKEAFGHDFVTLAKLLDGGEG